jgi:hypothetical protein
LQRSYPLADTLLHPHIVALRKIKSANNAVALAMNDYVGEKSRRPSAAVVSILRERVQLLAGGMARVVLCWLSSSCSSICNSASTTGTVISLMRWRVLPADPIRLS